MSGEVLAPLLDVRDLHTEFRTGAGTIRAVDGISYAVEPGETVAIVGESGSGKSVSALSILRLIPDPPGRITGGEVRFLGRDLMQLSDEEMRTSAANPKFALKSPRVRLRTSGSKRH